MARKVKILSYERLRLSTNGNPRFRFVFQDGDETEIRQSQTDAGFCYAVGNPGMGVGSTVEIELSKAGRVTMMSPVSE